MSQDRGRGSWFRRELAPRCVFPVVMSLGLWSVYAMMGAGVSPAFAAFCVSVVGLIAIGVLEVVLPYREQWGESDGDVKADLLHMVIAQVALPRLLKPLWVGLLVAATGWASKAFGGSAWPGHWPLLAQLFLMLLIAEFGRYWVHRWSHESALLWRLHAVHHSPNRLYFFNAGRFHPIEKTVFLIPEVVPFIVLGTNPETLAMYGVFNSLHGLFQHSNIDVRGGVLNYVFSLTELHRWHHSKEIEESDHNYGNNLIVWDIVFGTFYWPRHREVGPVGLLNPEYPKDYLGHLAAPFAGRDISKPEGWEPPSVERSG